MVVTPRIEQAYVLKDKLVYIKFCDGKEKVFDMSNLIETNEFYKKLNNRDYFNKVHPRGITIEWPNGEDVCPENLYFDSVDYVCMNKK